MIDYGGQKTDLAVKRAEWRLSRVYGQAAREIEEKTKDWQERHAAKDKRFRQMVKDGKMSKADYQAWLKGQVFQEKQWKARQEQIQQVLLNADKAAVNVIKDGKLGVFTANANYIGYGLEHDSGLNTGFLLYDEQTVARLIKGNPKMLPMLPPEKAINKDKAYLYYNRLINNAITQGIIQGESVQDIAVRIAKTTGEKCYKSALSNARTAYTGAQNAGRIEGMHQAQRLGIKVQKQWLATPDDRTRDAHADLDGQIQNVDDPFDSELGNIDYPGDPNADPANVYNCRCSLLYVYPEYPAGFELRDDYAAEMSLDDWEEAKQSNSNQPITSNQHYDESTERILNTFDDLHVERKKVKKLSKPLTTQQIIDKIGGGDRTEGSCTSVCLAYAGNRAGYDVRDFRGGKSQSVFSVASWKISEMEGVSSQRIKSNNSRRAAEKLISGMTKDKEYILVTGEHAAIVRKDENGKDFYLELQSPRRNGWKTLNREALKTRFKSQTSRTILGMKPEDENILIDVESLGKSPGFPDVLSFLNTDEKDQQKGRNGRER